MKIEVLGTGCMKCKTLEENARKAADKLGLDCEIEKVTSIADITRRGVMMTPALMIDGEVISLGKVLSPSEIITILSSKQMAHP